MSAESPFPWEMESREESFLRELPEIVELWHARPYFAADDDPEIFYLSEDRGVDGMRAMARSSVAATLDRMMVQRAHIIAIDLERQTAQVVLDAEQD